MIKCLDDVFKSSGPPGLVGPVELKSDEMRGLRIVPLCLLGIFNPFGPTLVALNLLVKESAPSAAVAWTSLNPFGQTRLVTARASTDLAELPALCERLYRVGDDFMLGSRPDLLLASADVDGLSQALKQMLVGLLSSVPSVHSLAKTNRDYRDHWKDPWNRISSMEEMMQQALTEQAEFEVSSPNARDFEEWFSLVTDMDHIVAELGAIIQAWTGSIEMVSGMPHMPLEDVAEELSVLGWPVFPRTPRTER